MLTGRTCSSGMHRNPVIIPKSCREERSFAVVLSHTFSNISCNHDHCLNFKNIQWQNKVGLLSRHHILFLKHFFHQQGATYREHSIAVSGHDPIVEQVKMPDLTLLASRTHRLLGLRLLLACQEDSSLRKQVEPGLSADKHVSSWKNFCSKHLVAGCLQGARDLLGRRWQGFLYWRPRFPILGEFFCKRSFFKTRYLVEEEPHLDYITSAFNPDEDETSTCGQALFKRTRDLQSKRLSRWWPRCRSPSLSKSHTSEM